MMIRKLSRVERPSCMGQLHTQMLCSVWLLVSKGSCQWRSRRHAWQINFLSGSVPPKHPSYTISSCNLNYFWTIFISKNLIRSNDYAKKKKISIHYSEDSVFSKNHLWPSFAIFPMSQRRYFNNQQQTTYSLLKVHVLFDTADITIYTNLHEVKKIWMRKDTSCVPLFLFTALPVFIFLR